MDHEIKAAAAKMALTGSIGGAGFAFTLNDVVAALTIFYLLLQIGLILPKYLQKYGKVFKKLFRRK